MLVVPGSSFNVPWRNHFRVTLLPEADELREVFQRIDRLLDRHVAGHHPEVDDARTTALA